MKTEDEIEQKRKELEDFPKKDKSHFYDKDDMYFQKSMSVAELKGFNLGIKLGEEKARKEFLDFLQALVFHSKEHDCIMVRDKIKELSKSSEKKK